MGFSREQFDAKVAEMRGRSDSQMNQSFDIWLDAPLTRLVISQIPAKEDSRDVLKMLLMSAFDAGFKAGGGSMLTEVVTTLSAANKDRDSK